MIPRSSSIALNLARHSISDENAGEPRELLNALFQSSTLGVAICDRRLRYRAVNDALASMNGIPAEAHLGRTIHAVLGPAAVKIQPAFEHVFATGQPLSNFEVTAELPSRGAVGHWNESYFPIKDRAGQVLQVGAVVLELTKRSELQASLLRLTNNLIRITSAVRHEPGPLGPKHLSNSGGRPANSLARSGALLERCLSEARAIQQLLQAAHPIEDEPQYLSPLSSREQEVIALLASGRSNKEVGSKLLISTRTVESHRARIMLKLDLHSFSELVRYAVRIHLIDP